MSSDRIDWESVPYCKNPPPDPAAYALRKDDILIARAGSVGASILLHAPPVHAVFASYLIRFRTNGAAAPRYIGHFLKSRDYWSAIADRSSGIAMPNVNATKLRTVEIPVAPLPEQLRIAAKLDELFSELDAGVAALERAQAKLERYRASVLKAAVEGRLTERWRQENPPTETGAELLERILAERRRRWEEAQLAAFEAKGKKPPRGWREKYKAPVAPHADGLPELPEGWCWATVDQVAVHVRYGSSAKTREDISDGVVVLRMGNIRDGRLELASLKYLPSEHFEFPDLLLQPGDLLFNRTNSAELVGKSAVYHGTPEPCSFASYLIQVRTVQGCEPDWLETCLNSPQGRAWAAEVVSQQVGQANINGSKLRHFAFPLPSHGEQLALLATVGGLRAAARHLGANSCAQLTGATHLRQSILAHAFEGRLVPQDPNDEPASVLLERIRAERAATSAAPGKRRRARRPVEP